MDKQDRRLRVWLVGGDGVVLFVVTLIGFATHGELSGAGLRLLSTLLPLGTAWAVAASALGLYQVSQAVNWKQLWRVLLAMLLAAPLAGILRGFWLNGVVIPVFVTVLGATSALGLLIWRAVFARLAASHLSKAGRHG
jgi:hypothetical protein